MTRPALPHQVSGHLAEAAGLPCPPLDLRPVPDVNVLKLGDGLREILMASSPVVHYLKTLDAQAIGNLSAADQEIDI